MISRHSELNAISKTESLFELVYQAAAFMNVAEMKKLINLGICFSNLKNNNGCTLIEALAEKGHDQAILLLTKHFYVPLVSTAILLKHVTQRQTFLKKKYEELKLKLHYAVKNIKESHLKSDFLHIKEEKIATRVKLEYCNKLIGHTQKIKPNSAMADGHPALAPAMVNFNSDREYIRTNVNLRRMIYDFSSGSKNEFSPELQYEIIQTLLNQENAIEQAVNGALSRDNIELFFSLCQKPLSQQLAHKIVGHLKGRQLISSNEEELLYFVARIKNENLRRAIIEDAYRNNIITNAKTFYLKAKKIIHLMNIEGLTYEQARAWKLNLHVWFLQGIQLVTQRRVSLDIFKEISSYVVGMPSTNTRALFTKHLNIQSHKLKNASIDHNIKKLSDSNKLWKSPYYIRMFKNDDARQLFVEENQKIDRQFNKRMGILKQC